MADPCLDPAPEIDLTVTGSPSALRATIVPSLDPYNGVSVHTDGLWTPGRPPILTSLPASPADGDEILFDPVVSGVLWHLRYRTAEASAYKWIVIGGPPLAARRKPSGTINPGGGNDWQTLGGTDVVGPSIQLPLSGYYGYKWGAAIDSAADGQAAQVGISPGGSDPDGDDVAVNTNARAASVMSEVPFNSGFGAQTAGVTMRLMYRCSGTGGTAVFYRRWIEVMPYKLG